MVRQSECLAMILAGGKGSRLGVLTKNVAKPAVLFGGKYRIIDFTLSNCRNSGIDTVGILTQYQPLELNWYIGNGSSWDLDSEHGGTFVLPPYMNDMDSSNWYQGTADAIYQNLNFLDLIDPPYVLVLSGDHIYRMDYGAMLAFHKKHRAQATVSTLRVPLAEASRFGIMNADAEYRITEFEEKPSHPKSDLASMGIYIFDTAVLRRYLVEDAARTDSEHDFGKNILPRMIADNVPVYAYPFEGYWKDVGTFESLWQANMDLLSDTPPLSLNDPDWRIYSGNQSLPPHYVGPEGSLVSSLAGEGAVIQGRVEHSVIFYDVTVEAGATVTDSVVMPGTVIEAGATVEHAILGERCRVRAGAVVRGTGCAIKVYGNDAVVLPADVADGAAADKGV
ncbi:MAG: glucose-1-phosphate adenylyltransferase [Selenomonadales bacterium]|nr:glucose-1-phosphate adenylyltransferase [Selenomonadales bacterium]